MISSENFNTFYINELAGIIEPLEKYRSENAKKLKRLFLTSIFCLPIFVIGLITLQPILIIITLVPTLFFLGLAYQQYQEMNNKLRYPFKNKVLLKAIDFFFEHNEYIANQRIAKNVFIKSMLFPASITTVKGEDFMRFRIGQVSIMFCEAKVYGILQKRLFKGLFISSSFNKYFKCKTIVFSKKSSYFLLRKKKKLFENMKKVRLENPEFEKHFYTISNHQIEARYILTTSLMRRILDYKAKTGKKISISFNDNRLFCAVPKYDDLFEVPFFDPIDMELVKRSLAPVILYTDIVEDLNLNLRIWTKQ